MMLVCSRWTMWALAGALMLGCNQPTGALSLPAAVGRPDDVSQGPRVGVIVALGGQVTIAPSKGKGFPGRPDQQLLRDDRLVTAGNSFVVVQLHNGHLVRLGADQSNVVEMLAPFHDPQAGEDVEARFVRLLTAEERDNPALSGAITRVAGWNTRMSASQSFAPLPAPERAKEMPPAPAPVSAEPPPDRQGQPGAPAPKNDEGYGSSAADKPVADTKNVPLEPPGAPPKPPAAPAKEEAPAKKKAPPKPEAPVDKDDATAKQGPASPAESEHAGDGPSPAQAPGAKTPPAPYLPTEVAFRRASGGQAHTEKLPEPLKSGATGLALCAGAGAKITGIVKGGKLTTLKVDGQLKCQTLVGKASTLPDGNFELIVLK
jgi:hypothetical protein